MHINMKKEKKYIEYILKQAEALLAIDSPSGFTEKVTDYLCEEYKRLGYKPDAATDKALRRILQHQRIHRQTVLWWDFPRWERNPTGAVPTRSP